MSEHQKLGPETRAIIEAIKGRGSDQSKLNRNMGNFDAEYIGENIFRCKLPADYLTATGAADQLALNVPFPHRWIRFHFYHVTAAGAVSENLMDITISRPAGRMLPAALTELLWSETGITEYEGKEVFGEGFEYEPASWNIIVTTTATDLVYPVIYIQRID